MIPFLGFGYPIPELIKQPYQHGHSKLRFNPGLKKKKRNKRDKRNKLSKQSKKKNR